MRYSECVCSSHRLNDDSSGTESQTCGKDELISPVKSGIPYSYSKYAINVINTDKNISTNGCSRAYTVCDIIEKMWLCVEV